MPYSPDNSGNYAPPRFGTNVVPNQPVPRGGMPAPDNDIQRVIEYLKGRGAIGGTGDNVSAEQLIALITGNEGWSPAAKQEAQAPINFPAMSNNAYGMTGGGNLLGTAVTGESMSPPPAGVAAPSWDANFPLAGLLQGGGEGGVTQPEMSDREALMQQIIGLIQGGTGDYQSTLESTSQAIKEAFGGQIGAVKGASDAAKQTTKQSNAQIDAMYRALGRNYDAAGDAELHRGKSYAKATQDVAKNAGKTVKQSADALLNEQAALASGLGVESATQAVATPQRAQVQGQLADIAQRGQTAANSNLGHSKAQQTYLDSQSVNAPLEGTNRQAELIAQLQEFLQGNQGKIADLKGQQGMALAQNQSSILDALTKDSGEQVNQLLDVYDRLYPAESSASNSQLADSGLPKYAQLNQSLLSASGLPVDSQQRVNDALSELMLKPDFKYQTVDNQYSGGAREMTGFEAQAQAQNYGKKLGLTPQEISLLQVLITNAQKELGG